MYKVVLHDQYGNEKDIEGFSSVKIATYAGHAELDRDSTVEGFTVEHADGTPLAPEEHLRLRDLD